MRGEREEDLFEGKVVGRTREEKRQLLWEKRRGTKLINCEREIRRDWPEGECCHSEIAKNPSPR